MKEKIEPSELYNAGKFSECLEEISRELVSQTDHFKKGDLIALQGWCYYRKGNYEKAREIFKQAGDIDFAIEGLLYLAAYRDKDYQRVKQLAQELGEDRVNVQNALTICARDAKCHVFSHKEVLEGVLRFKESTVEAANLYHNAGRFFFHKARNKKDLVKAIELLDESLTCYGIDRNWHHRGAANFWKSKILEALLDKKGALEVARDSLFCWTQQVILDSANRRHLSQWENSIKRVRELLK